MLARNSLAHLGARVASLGAGVVAIPMVAAFLGNEALGLVGMQASLQAMIGLFDLGLPTAANREMALLGARNADWNEKSAFIRTLEALQWLVALAFLAVGLLAADPLANGWLNVNDLPKDTVRAAVMLIIAGIAVRFPIAFYSNVCFGLGRHIFPNAATGFWALARVTLSLVALAVFEVDVMGFFALQLVLGCGEVGMIALGIWWRRNGWNALPRLRHLKAVAGQSAILTGISLSAVGLAQIDKIILSRLLSLADFGVYSAAYTLATGLLAFSYPICNAIFPSLTEALERREPAVAQKLVYWGTELTLLLIVPLGAATIAQASTATDILFFFGKGSPDLAALLPPMVLGGIAQAFVTIPHFYQVAANRASVVLLINIAFLPVYTALTLAMAMAWGSGGAAGAFLLFNVFRLLAQWAALAKVAQDRRFCMRLTGTVAAVTLVCLGCAFLLGMIPVLPKPGVFAATVAALGLSILAVLPGLRNAVGRRLLLLNSAYDISGRRQGGRR